MHRANVATYPIVGLAILSLLLFGCGGGGGGGGGNAPAPPPPLGTDASFASLSISGVTLDPAFSSAVTSYTATVPFGSNSVDVTATTTDGSASFTINGSNNATVTLSIGDNNINIVVTAENGTTTRTYTIVVTRLNLAQEAYIKASNTDPTQTNAFGDYFGVSISLSGNGNTLAVGASGEDSGATGVNGDQTNENAPLSGAVYVFTRDSADVWTQQAYIKASDTHPSDRFGRSVALSDDGNTLTVGASGEDSGATGVNGDQTNFFAAEAGAVYVFTRDSGGVWAQEAYVKASNTDADDRFGIAVALSGGGNTLAVGASSEESAATGVNGDQTDNSAADAGAVYVFTRDSAGIWTQQAYVKASNTDGDDGFGGRVALSDDGNSLAVGAFYEDSAATGVNGDQADNFATDAGAVYVFTRDTGGVWTQHAYVKASNTDVDDRFGYGFVLSADGNMLAIGAYGESSAATGVDGDQMDNSLLAAGAVYVFSRDSGGPWAQQAYVKASNTDGADGFGVSVALSGDGRMLAVGASEDSAAPGVNGDQTDNSASNAGAVYVFTRDSGGAWTQQAYVKASNPVFVGEFGTSPAALALSSDSSMLAVGGYRDRSAATGVNGDQTDTSSLSAGAVYVFR